MCGSVRKICVRSHNFVETINVGGRESGFEVCSEWKGRCCTGVLGGMVERLSNSISRRPPKERAEFLDVAGVVANLLLVGCAVCKVNFGDAIDDIARRSDPLIQFLGVNR